MIGISNHLKLNVTIPPMVVSGLENYAHWINICSAVTSPSYHVQISVRKVKKYSNCYVKILTNTRRKNVQDVGMSVLTAMRQESTKREQLLTLRYAPMQRYCVQMMAVANKFNESRFNNIARSAHSN